MITWLENKTGHVKWNSDHLICQAPAHTHIHTHTAIRLHDNNFKVKNNCNQLF